MDIDRSEFEAMTFNPLKNPKELIWDVYTKLRKNPFFRKLGEIYEPSNASALLRFIILYIDYESPMSGEKDLDIRKKECLRILSIKKGSDGTIYDIILKEEGKFNECIREYIRYVQSYDYQNWLVLSQHRAYIMDYLLTKPKFGDKNSDNDMAIRARLGNELATTADNLLQLEAKLFPEPRIERLIKDMLMEDSFAGYAEKYAKNAE
jgi:hypothetical protein